MDPKLLFVIFIVVTVIIIVWIIRKILFLGRNIRNDFRSAMGDDSVEMEKAKQILAKTSKNGLILKWAINDAISTLSKYYSSDSSVDCIHTYLSENGLEWVDVPRSFYKEPGTSKEELFDTCISYFNKFDLRPVDENGNMSKHDFATFKNLVYMWFFADTSVHTKKEAEDIVLDIYTKFYENHLSKQS